jgi:hypothetical protein
MFNKSSIRPKGNHMKTLNKIVAATVLATVALTASAQHRGNERGGNGGNNDRALGIGLVIGALGAAAIYQNQQPVIVQQAPVYVAPPPVYYSAPPVYVEQPPVVYLQDGTRLTYSYRSGLWVDNQGRAYNLPR